MTEEGKRAVATKVRIIMTKNTFDLKADLAVCKAMAKTARTLEVTPLSIYSKMCYQDRFVQIT